MDTLFNDYVMVGGEPLGTMFEVFVIGFLVFISFALSTIAWRD